MSSLSLRFSVVGADAECSDMVVGLVWFGLVWWDATKFSPLIKPTKATEVRDDKKSKDWVTRRKKVPEIYAQHWIQSS